MTLQLVETPFRDTVTSVFEGDGVRVTFARGVGNTTFEQDARPVLTGRIAP